ncbi:MAG: hypothetical protein ABSB78_08200 [Bacteroidota bacterium]
MLYYPPHSIADTTIASILIAQENNYFHIRQIIKFPDSTTFPKINIWLFRDSVEKYKKTHTRSSAHSLQEYWSEYCVVGNARGAHETAHLLINRLWGDPVSQKYRFLLDEGFSIYCDEARFIQLGLKIECSEAMLDRKYTIRSVIADSSDSLDLQKKSIITGTFIKYLIESYGIEKFSILWKTAQEEETIFQRIYSRSQRKLEKGFMLFLQGEPRRLMNPNRSIEGKG